MQQVKFTIMALHWSLFAVAIGAECSEALYNDILDTRELSSMKVSAY